MKKLLFTVTFLLTFSLSYSQWISTFSGISGSDVNFANAKGNAVVCDAYGNSYVTGYAYEEGNNNDIVLIKYNPQGEYVWAKSYNGSASLNDEGKGIRIDNEGNIFVVGFAEIEGKSTDIAILKYSPDGDLVWDNFFRSSESPLSDVGNAIALDLNGNIYVTGYAKDDDGLKDFVVIKYDQSGTIIWNNFIDGVNNLDAEGIDIAISAAGDVYATGYTTVSPNNTDIEVIKLSSSSGTILYNTTISGSANQEDKAWGIVVDTDGAAYITGFITDDIYPDCYTAKLNSEGTIIWQDSYNGGGNHIDKAWGIVVDTDGSVYITGESTDENMNVNYVTIKYTSDGLRDWTNFYNGIADYIDVASAIGIIVNSNNSKSIIVTGKSFGYDNNFDYATVRYNAATGIQNQVSTYSFTSITNDISKDLAIFNNKVIVTGLSQLIIESSVEQSYISTLMIGWGKESELVTNTTTPEKYVLYQNYPNPFNPSTTIKFDIAVSGNVKLTVYDMLGRVVSVLVNQHLNQGTHNISFRDMSLSSGIYFYELKTGNYRDIKKMTLVK